MIEVPLYVREHTCLPLPEVPGHGKWQSKACMSGEILQGEPRSSENACTYDLTVPHPSSRSNVTKRGYFCENLLHTVARVKEAWF